MKQIIKEPFFHFIVIGFGLFLLYGLINNNTESTDTITIDDNDISAFIAKWESQWKRDPNESELLGLINQNLHQEIYYREALKMNLDQNDEIIKRRLFQKMKFFASDLASLNKVDDNELRIYYKENAEKYMTTTSYSLYQIIFTSDNRNNPQRAAENILKKFPNANFEAMKNKGDKLPIPYLMENLTEDELRSQLGVEFKEQIQSVEINKWVGPIASGYGKHLIYITKKEAPQLPKLESVKRKVTGDYEYDNQQKLEESIYLELKKNYIIELDIQSKDFDPEFVKLLQEEINR